jgi:hypothetical protein
MPFKIILDWGKLDNYNYLLFSFFIVQWFLK